MWVKSGTRPPGVRTGRGGGGVGDRGGQGDGGEGGGRGSSLIEWVRASEEQGQQEPKAGLGMKDGKREEGEEKTELESGARNEKQKRDRRDAPETRRGDDRL